MRIEIISVGKELITGSVRDRASPYMAERFSSAGVTVARITCLDDSSGDITAAIRESVERGAQVLVVAGGLGVARGSVTLRAVSQVAGVKLFADPAALRLVKKRWEVLSKKGVLPLPSPSFELVKMAVIPSGAELLKNTTGIVPGIKMRVGGMTIYCLPGEPGEMRTMFEEAVYPEVALLIGGGAVAVRKMRIRSRDDILLRRRIRMVEGRFPSISIMARPRGDGGEEEITVEFIAIEGTRAEAYPIERAVKYFQKLQEGGEKGEETWIAE